MKKIKLHRGVYYVERGRRMWADVLSAVLFVLWVITALIPGLTGATGAGGVIFGTVILLVPALILSYGPSRPKRWKIAAVVDGRDVPGGVLLTVMDVRNQRHELIVDQAVAVDLAKSLEAATVRP